jgi:murein DD-endopeptidase MepM/ murein hydrolase activator NlpD
MVNPAPGYRVTTPYGTPGNWAAGYHPGEDYACPEGTAVAAAAAGTVISAAYDGDYGNRVEVLTGSVLHAYCHLSGFEVSEGDQVAAGQTIGRSGTTGRSTGPHLHYEERVAPYGYYDDRAPQFSHDAGGDDDMTPEQAATLDNIAWTVGQIKGQTDQISPGVRKPVDDTAWGVLDPEQGLRTMVADIQARLDRIESALSDGT